jgi:hypothetical protein
MAPLLMSHYPQARLLADIKTSDNVAHRVIQESFVSGYDVMILIAAILALASSLSAALIIVRTYI